MAHPDWAVKFRRPGTELRKVNDALYKLYECSSVYDKEKKERGKLPASILAQSQKSAGSRNRASG